MSLQQKKLKQEIVKLEEENGCLYVEYLPVDDVPIPDREREAAIRTVTEVFEQYAKLSGAVPQNFFKNLEALSEHESRFADTIASQMPFKVSDKQKILESGNIEERFFLLLKLIQKETEVFTMSQKIKGRVKEQMESLQKKHYLNEQIRAIKKEMGEAHKGWKQMAPDTKRFEALGAPVHPGAEKSPQGDVAIEDEPQAASQDRPPWR